MEPGCPPSCIGGGAKGYRGVDANPQGGLISHDKSILYGYVILTRCGLNISHNLHASVLYNVYCIVFVNVKHRVLNEYQ